jgi:hypothetical protein
MLTYVGGTLRSVSWQQDQEFRRRTRELLGRDDWNPLLGELLGFLQRLETAPSTAFGPPVSPAMNPAGDQKVGSNQSRRKRGRPRDTNLKEDKRVFDAWQTRQHMTYADLARALGKGEREVKAAIDRERKRRERRHL